MSDPTVTMALSEHLAQRKRSEEMEAEIAQLKQQLINAKFEDPSLRVPKLAQLARDLLPVVQFAMANCSPRDIKKWPWKELMRVAIGLEALPDHSQFDEELSREMLKFAAECEDWDLRRRYTPEKEVPPPFPVEDHPVVRMMRGQEPAAPPTLQSDPGAQLPSPPSESDVPPTTDNGSTESSTGTNTAP